MADAEIAASDLLSADQVWAFSWIATEARDLIKHRALFEASAPVYIQATMQRLEMAVEALERAPYPTPTQDPHP